MSEWQPIETAPTFDNPLVLAFTENGDYEIIRGSCAERPYFTHWTPLPAPPEGEE